MFLCSLKDSFSMRDNIGTWSYESAQKLLDDIEKYPLRNGENWYIISLKWWNELVRWIDSRLEPPPPAAMDLAELTISNGAKYELKPNLQERGDYVLVPEFAFRLLRDRFGVVNAERDVVMRQVITRDGLQPFVGVYLFSIKVARADRVSSPVQLQLSRRETISSLRHRVFSMLDLDETKQYDYYLVDRDKIEKLELLEDGDFENLALQNRIIVIDMPDEHSILRYSNYKPKRQIPDNSLRAPASASVSSVEAIVPLHTPGVCGLSNLGNTCFMNSAIQCASNITELTEYFRSGRYITEINEENPLGAQGELARAYADLINQLWSGNHSHIVPRNFKNVVGHYAPRFSGFQQQDSQELLAYLLDGLHEDLNRVRKKPLVPCSEYDDGRPAELAEKAWENHLKRNDSIIVDIMHGQLVSKVVCAECHKASLKFDAWNFFPLTVPYKDKPTRLSVVFIPLSPVEKWRCFSVSLYNQTTVKTVRLLLCEKLDMDRDTNMLFAVVERNKLKKIMQEDANMLDAFPRERYYSSRVVYAWQVETRVGAPANILVVQNKLKGVDEPACLPMLFAVEPVSELPRSMIDDKILPRAKKYFMDKSYHIDSDSGGSSGSGCSSDQEGNVESHSPYGNLVAIEWAALPQSSISSRNLLNEETITWPKSEPHLATMNIVWNRAEFGFNQVSNLLEIDVTVPSEKKSTYSLLDCLDLTTQKDDLYGSNAWDCPFCKKLQSATKQLGLWRMPQIMMLHLKRFRHTRWSREKIDTPIEIPVKNLTLDAKVTASGCEKNVYDLVAVINHFGGLGGGHYTAWAQNGGCWYDYNDSSVTPIQMSPTSFVSRDAYVLIYRRVSLSSSSCASLAMHLMKAEPNIEMEVDN
ncbi:hypothetical protein AB6A40_004909 [Gnathostoma spinigerum]|uniref:Ubiquitin carboxyl-terminal hydrolase n=1 Tax=Gnathostoma spinigerum TaxID=75299 RepID=A0ABD6EDX3_9BILA